MALNPVKSGFVTTCILHSTCACSIHFVVWLNDTQLQNISTPSQVNIVHMVQCFIWIGLMWAGVPYRRWMQGIQMKELRHGWENLSCYMFCKIGSLKLQCKFPYMWLDRRPLCWSPVASIFLPGVLCLELLQAKQKCSRWRCTHSVTLWPFHPFLHPKLDLCLLQQDRRLGKGTVGRKKQLQAVLLDWNVSSTFRQDFWIAIFISKHVSLCGVRWSQKFAVFSLCIYVQYGRQHLLRVLSWLPHIMLG